MSQFSYRTVWISDTHLGSRGCQAIELVRFLDYVECETLYLVGDIIDFWRLRGRAFWPMPHNEVLHRILGHVERGTSVVFVPGNHDESARHYLGVNFGGIRIVRDDVHRTADGRRLLVTHGDEYDLVVKHSRLVSLIGSAAYEWLITLNRLYNKVRSRFGLSKSSFSKTIKLKVKSACKYVSAYEETLRREAVQRGLDGVICGHVHKPEIDVDGPVEYFNTGDWIESCTALVEHADGRMEIVSIDDLDGEVAARRGATVETVRSAATVPAR